MGAGERGRRGGGRRRRRARAARNRHRRQAQHRQAQQRRRRRRTGGRSITTVSRGGTSLSGGQNCARLKSIFFILLVAMPLACIGGILTGVGCAVERNNLCVIGPVLLVIGIVCLILGIICCKSYQNRDAENANYGPNGTNVSGNNITFVTGGNIDLESGFGMFDTPPSTPRMQTVAYHVTEPSAPSFNGSTAAPNSTSYLPPPSYDSVTQQQQPSPNTGQTNTTSLNEPGYNNNTGSNPTVGLPPPPSYSDVTGVNTERNNEYIQGTYL